jgi:hypothetical protein
MSLCTDLLGENGLFHQFKDPVVVVNVMQLHIPALAYQGWSIKAFFFPLEREYTGMVRTDIPWARLCRKVSFVGASAFVH